MSFEKGLKKPTTIRGAGFLLAILPIGGFVIAAGASGVDHWLSLQGLLSVTQSVSPLSWVLWISAIAGGTMMMKGERSSWNATLCMIGVNALAQTFSCLQDETPGRYLSAAAVVLDLILLALVYSQEFLQRGEKKHEAAKVDRMFQAVASREFSIQFDGFGTWAKIVGINEDGLFVRPLTEKVPTQIKTRAIELQLGKALTLKAHFSQMRGDEYFFQFYDLTEETAEQLRSWANSIQSAASADQSRLVA